MANWSSLVLTKKGRDLQAKCEAGETLVLSRIKIGSGTPEDIDDLTDLVDPKQNLGISSREFVGDGTCKITATLTNEDLSEGYYMRELGVFATDPDDGDILYGVTTDSAPDFMPSSGGAVAVSQEFAVFVAIANVDNVVVNVSPEGMVTADEVEAMIKEHDDDPDAHEAAFEAHGLGGNSASGSNAIAVLMVAATPNCYRRAELMTPNKTTITVHANTQVNINGNGYISTEDVTLNLGDVLAAATRAGTDMYVYACEPDAGTEPVFVVSANSTVPDGYDANNSRKIGGFHCLCLAVGDISGHKLSGYNTGDIIPNTVWDLQFRASSDNEGMAYIEGLDIWVDIYPASYNGEKLISAYGEVPCTGATGGLYVHGDILAENFGFAGKRLITRDEFVFFAKGSNECTNVEGSANPGTAGGHVDTDGRRMISNYGIEDCCGAWWAWAGNIWGTFNCSALSSPTNWQQYGGTHGGPSSYLEGFAWDRPGEGSNVYVDHSRLYDDIDGDNIDKFGDSYGALPRCLVGGCWSVGVGCGSRSVSLGILSACADSGNGGRGASGPRCVNTL